MTKRAKLYHCIPGEVRGDRIEPRATYGASIPQTVWQELGIVPGEEKLPLIFAANHIGKALAFSFPKASDTIMFNGTLDEAGTEYAVVCNRKRTMAIELNATIFSFSGDHFAELEGHDQQVSPRTIPFSEAEIVMKIANVDDLMRAGLQILSFEGSFGAVGGYPAIDKRSKEQGKSMFDVLADDVAEGKLVWENLARGMNPVSAMGNALKKEPLAPLHFRR